MIFGVYQVSTLTFDFYKVGSNEESHQSAATLAVHGHTVGHALAHDDGAVHDHHHQRNQRV